MIKKLMAVEIQKQNKKISGNSIFFLFEITK
jgi:hypothetical protein